MKKYFLYVCLTVLLTAAPVYPAFAKTEIGVIDFVKVISDSKAGVDIREQLRTKEKEYTDQIKSKEEELNGKRDELNAQKGVVGPEIFDKNYEEFKKEVFDTKKDVHAKKVLLENKKNEAIETIRTTAIEIIQKVAEEQNLAIVVAKSNVIHTKLSADITDEVMTRLNKKLPDVKIAFDN